jgi:hypothetical protein
MQIKLDHEGHDQLLYISLPLTIETNLISSLTRLIPFF